MKGFLHKLTAGIIPALFAVCILSGCSMVEEEHYDCPEGLYVRFIYDYNTIQANGTTADLFNDHVGHLRLYVFDEEGKMVASRTVSNTADHAPLSEYGYTMHFPSSEVPAGHSYRLQAIAMDKDWDESLNTDGAKYRIKGEPTAHHENLVVNLDHESTPFINADGEELYAVSDEAPLDIFWHTLKVTPHEPVDGRPSFPIDRTVAPFDAYPAADQRVKVEAGKTTYATVSMIRDTKHLTVGLHQIDSEKKKEITADLFDVSITDANCCVDHSNAVNTHHTLCYTPYASWTVALDEDGTTSVETVQKGDLGQYGAATKADGTKNVVERQAHYNMMFNRLMINDNNSAKNATLHITDKATGKEVVNVNLPHYLSMGRDAYSLAHYGSQEYLDREYDYHLDFFLSGDRWVAIEIHVLSWSLRLNNLDF